GTSLRSGGCSPRRVSPAYGGVARMRPSGARSKGAPIFRVPAIHAKIAPFFIDKLSRQSGPRRQGISSGGVHFEERGGAFSRCRSRSTSHWRFVQSYAQSRGATS